MLDELRESERLMTAFGEHCQALLLASLQSHSQAPATVRVRGQRQRSWFPFDAPSNASGSSALTAVDVQCLSALLLSSRTVAATSAARRIRSLAHEDLLPAAVRAACEALVAFLPQSKFGDAAAAADKSKKGNKPPVRAC